MKMTENWSIQESTAPARWKVGLYLWRDEGEWRFRLYRPWNRTKLIEVQSKDFLVALYILGISAEWWKDKIWS